MFHGIVDELHEEGGHFGRNKVRFKDIQSIFKSLTKDLRKLRVLMEKIFNKGLKHLSGGCTVL